MARDRAVSFTLPADLYAIAAERGKVRGMTADEYLRERLVDALGRQKIRQERLALGGKGPVEPRWKDKDRR